MNGPTTKLKIIECFMAFSLNEVMIRGRNATKPGHQWRQQPHEMFLPVSRTANATHFCKKPHEKAARMALGKGPGLNVSLIRLQLPCVVALLFRLTILASLGSVETPSMPIAGEALPRGCI
jgi:hypothetical protein